MTNGSPNRAILVHVAREIESILSELVFVGGQVADLLVTSPGVTRIRPTVDVDVVVEVTSRTEFGRLERRLRRLGLETDSGEGAIIGRWHTPSGNVLDVIPTDPRILGFSNRWYALTIETAARRELEPDLVIRIPTSPVFLATKWEALLGRGADDVLGSHDLEVVITVVTGRRPGIREGPDVWEVAMVASEAGDDPDALEEHFGGRVEREALEQALAYADRFRDSVEERLAENERVGRMLASAAEE